MDAIFILCSSLNDITIKPGYGDCSVDGDSSSGGGNWLPPGWPGGFPPGSGGGSGGGTTPPDTGGGDNPDFPSPPGDGSTGGGTGGGGWPSDGGGIGGGGTNCDISGGPCVITKPVEELPPDTYNFDDALADYTRVIDYHVDGKSANVTMLPTSSAVKITHNYDDDYDIFIFNQTTSPVIYTDDVDGHHIEVLSNQGATNLEGLYIFGNLSGSTNLDNLNHVTDTLYIEQDDTTRSSRTHDDFAQVWTFNKSMPNVLSLRNLDWLNVTLDVGNAADSPPNKYWEVSNQSTLGLQTIPMIFDEYYNAIIFGGFIPTQCSFTVNNAELTTNNASSITYLRKNRNWTIQTSGLVPV